MAKPPVAALRRDIVLWFIVWTLEAGALIAGAIAGDIWLVAIAVAVGAFAMTRWSRACDAYQRSGR